MGIGVYAFCADDNVCSAQPNPVALARISRESRRVNSHMRKVLTDIHSILLVSASEAQLFSSDGTA